NEKVAGLVTTVRIKGGMTEAEFSNHVLYVSGQKNTSGNKTGARCDVDVLLAADLLREDNGKLAVSAASVKEAPADIKPAAVDAANVHGNGGGIDPALPSQPTLPQDGRMTSQS